jgi:hypothetical protein
VLGRDIPEGDHIVGAGRVAIQLAPGSAPEFSAKMAKAAQAGDESHEPSASRARALAVRKQRYTGPPSPRMDGRKQ